MDRVESLRIEKFRLNYSLDSFLEHLEEGNSQKLSMSAKKVINDISSYLIVEENLLASYVRAGKGSSLFSDVRKQHREIHSLLSDLYTIHVTEPDGEFVKIMIEVVDKGIKRLDYKYEF